MTVEKLTIEIAKEYVKVSNAIREEKERFPSNCCEEVKKQIAINMIRRRTGLR